MRTIATLMGVTLACHSSPGIRAVREEPSASSAPFGNVGPAPGQPSASASTFAQNPASLATGISTAEARKEFQQSFALTWGRFIRSRFYKGGWSLATDANVRFAGDWLVDLADRSWPDGGFRLVALSSSSKCRNQSEPSRVVCDGTDGNRGVTDVTLLSGAFTWPDGELPLGWNFGLTRHDRSSGSYLPVPGGRIEARARRVHPTNRVALALFAKIFGYTFEASLATPIPRVEYVNGTWIAHVRKKQSIDEKPTLRSSDPAHPELHFGTTWIRHNIVFDSDWRIDADPTSYSVSLPTEIERSRERCTTPNGPARSTVPSPECEAF